MQLGRGIDHLGERLRIRDALRCEELLVPVHDPRIEVERQAHYATVGFDCVLQPALGKIWEVEVGRGHRFVVDVRPEIGEPVILRELPLLHVVGERDHVEARVARVELDHRFLALLLLGHHFRAYFDAGQLLEFLVILREQIAARTLHQQDFDLLSLEALPVECALGVGDNIRAGQRTERGGCASGLQQSATQSVGVSIVVHAVSHGVPPLCVRSWRAHPVTRPHVSCSVSELRPAP